MITIVYLFLSSFFWWGGGALLPSAPTPGFAPGSTAWGWEGKEKADPVSAEARCSFPLPWWSAARHPWLYFWRRAGNRNSIPGHCQLMSGVAHNVYFRSGFSPPPLCSSLSPNSVSNSPEVSLPKVSTSYLSMGLSRQKEGK